MSKGKKKVAIVGFAHSRDQAPFNDPEFEIWTVNHLHVFVPRQDRVFQLHQRKYWEPGDNNPDLHDVSVNEHLEFLKTCGIPVYTVEKYDDIPTSVRFPIEKMTEEFGIQATGDVSPDSKEGYWTNTISMMIALAIYEKFDVIEIYGVDMAVSTEYNHQRPSCEYYIGIAKGRGIDVRVPVGCDLLKSRFIYGFEEEKANAWRAKIAATAKLMREQRGKSEQALRNQQSISDKYEGAITAIQEMMRAWS